MELAQFVTQMLNTPALNFTPVHESPVKKVLETRNIKTEEELKAYYGEQWFTKFRTDYLDLTVWS